MFKKVITLEKVKELYLERALIQCAKGTYDCYDKHLTKIIDFLNSIKIKKTDQIGRENINAFILNERKINKKNVTINKRVESLKQALKYCKELDYISKNNLEYWRNLPKEPHETKIIDIENLKKILKHVEEKETIRNKALIFLLLTTGIRRSELLNLKAQNFDFEKGLLTLTKTKTNKIRRIPLEERTIIFLSDHLKDCKDIFIFNLVPNSINAIFYKIKKNLGLASKLSLSPHKWRHTYATMCLENGSNLEFIRNTLGHSNLTTTQKYLHLSTKALQSEHARVNPLANLT